MSKAQTMTLLSVMMFLEFFVWGSWYVTQATFLNGMGWGDVIADAYSVGPIAAIIAPVFLGLIADRFFAAQKALGVMQLLAGGAMIANYLNVTGEAPSSSTYIVLLQIHMLCFMPTLGLTNTIAFHAITDQEKQFPVIRVFGTLGWIFAVTLVSKWLNADTGPQQFLVAGVAAASLGVFAFFLPNTPPPAAGKKVSMVDTLGLGAIGLCRDRSFAIFLIASFLVCIPLAAYYAMGAPFVATAFDNPGFIMTFGQWAEVGFMVVMPLFFKRLGVKKMLAFGMAAWVLRYGLFSGAADEGVKWMIFGGILLHGICYDFFFVTGQIYVDQVAHKEIRGQAQSFLVVVTQGLGMLIGAQLTGQLVEVFSSGEGEAMTRDWASIWMWPAVGAMAILVVFLVSFRDRPKGQVA